MDNVTADVAEIARELEPEVEPENGTERLHLMINEQVRSCSFWRSKERGFWSWNLLLVRTL